MERGTGDAFDATEDYRRRFDALFARGSGAVLAGTHHRDTPLIDGGRWGMSVVLVPDDAVASQVDAPAAEAMSVAGSLDALTAEAMPLAGLLDALTAEAMVVAGPEHWPTGRRPAAHVTVRAIDAHRPNLKACDPLATRAAAALDHAAAASEPVRLRLSGLTLTPSGIMLCGYPLDRTAGDLASRLRTALGPDARFEEHFHRDIWYATLVHFAGAIPDPQALVRWVDQRRELPVCDATFAAVELVRFVHDGRQPIRVRLARAALRGAAGPAARAPGGASASAAHTPREGAAPAAPAAR